MQPLEKFTRRIVDTVLTRNRQARRTLFAAFPLPTFASTSMSVEKSSSTCSAPTSTPLQEDNPCWGSPTQCDLKHLISQYPKESCIVFESSHYVVLNKPPDLRMDGPYPATVHKLLTYWYPPPSLLSEAQNSNTNDDELLLNAVTKLHQHNSISDNALRPCHQLDYATSGLLCVARTQAAAAHAIRQWEQRQVTKEYLALVEGSNHLKAMLSQHEESPSMPCFSPAQIQSTLQRLEDTYKKSRRPRSQRKEDQKTFLGFQPAHAIFQKYKASMLAKNNNHNNSTKKKKRGRPEVLTPEQWQEIWKPVEDAIRQEEISHKNSDDENSTPSTTAWTETRTLLQELDWKQLCRTNLKWKSVFQQAAELHNNILRRELQKDEEDEDENDNLPNTFPIIFGETMEDSSPFSNDTKLSVVYICCPLGQGSDPYDFSMKVPPDPELLEKYPHMKHFVGSPDLDYKPCLTKCTILDCNNSSSYGGSPVTTKVQLLPLTGRRHQLRLHMALLVGGGYGILGDATYNRHTLTTDRRNPPSLSNTTDKNDDAVSSSPLGTSTQRMCLHSHKLSLRLDPTNESSHPNDEPMHLEASDPF